MSQLELTPKEVYARLQVAIMTDIVPFLVSSPGMGKSAMTAQLAEEFGLEMIDMRASQYDSVDFAGMPSRGANGRAEYLPFNIIPIEGDHVPDHYEKLTEEGMAEFNLVKVQDHTWYMDSETGEYHNLYDGDQVPKGKNGWLLFLDEITSTRQIVVPALYKVLLDRQVGDRNIHPKVRIVCAGNHASDRAQVTRLGTAFNSRVMHLYMKPNLEDWLDDFAIPTKVDDRIISFLMQFKDDFYKFDPEAEHKPFSCARSWDMVNKIIKGSQRMGKQSSNNDDLDIPMFDGLLSAGVASKFVGYCDVFGLIPSVTDVVLSPGKAIVPETNDACYATATSMSSNTDANNISQICDYIARLPKIHGAVYATLLAMREPRLSTNPSLVRLTSKVMAK